MKTLACLSAQNAEPRVLPWGEEGGERGEKKGKKRERGEGAGNRTYDHRGRFEEALRSDDDNADPKEIPNTNDSTHLLDPYLRHLLGGGGGVSPPVNAFFGQDPSSDLASFGNASLAPPLAAFLSDTAAAPNPWEFMESFKSFLAQHPLLFPNAFDGFPSWPDLGSSSFPFSFPFSSFSSSSSS
eukprot:CAMPEP_0175040338 /NCGR_PEP_ID=MMETSP0052_2-20121109/1199_1 /TAXON_ID=51329 ORGANISM="Polytomella parva, Strain SAG 63-3" /NCGR_SAMPLE_ID=MMETSP0052_2 /ASSEMBLY_ACC=CAM_ASM_000194 /LENGTH=183 /DNA_ID=CAMNT_0016302521 /DNA_START=143 /DNA_END=690 /DNA_ORIENTATION=+